MILVVSGDRAGRRVSAGRINVLLCLPEAGASGYSKTTGGVPGLVLW